MSLLPILNGKNNMNNRSILLKNVIASLAMSIVFAGGTANAGIYTDTVPFSVNGTTPSNISLSSFNPAYGTLTDVSLTVMDNLTPQVEIVNFTAASQMFEAQSTSILSLNGPGSTSMTFTATGQINGTAPAAPVSTFFGQTLSQTQVVSLSQAVWGEYVGTGSLNFIASFAPFVSSITAPAALAVGGNGSANGDITIAYSFDSGTSDVLPTPIPAAVLLLGSGLMGLAGFRQRKS